MGYTKAKAIASGTKAKATVKPAKISVFNTERLFLFIYLSQNVNENLFFLLNINCRVTLIIIQENKGYLILTHINYVFCNFTNN